MLWTPTLASASEIAANTPSQIMAKRYRAIESDIKSLIAIMLCGGCYPSVGGNFLNILVRLVLLG